MTQKAHPRYGKGMTREDTIAVLIDSDNEWAQVTGAVMQHDPKISQILARARAAKIIRGQIKAPWL